MTIQSAELIACVPIEELEEARMNPEVWTRALQAIDVERLRDMQTILSGALADVELAIDAKGNLES